MRCLSVILIFIFTLCHAGTYHPAIEYIFPLPESGLHSPQVTIFLRLHEELHHDIQNLNTFINITGDESVFHGQVIMSSDSRTIIFKPDQNFPLNNTVYVNILTTQIGYTDFNYYFTIASQNTNYLPAVEDFDSHAEIPISTSSAGQIRLINGVAVPSDFPQIEAHQYGETAPGYIFISSNFKSSGIGNYLIMCENDGTPYCYRHFNIPHNIANFVHQSTGVFSAYFFAPEYHVILDSTFAPIDLYRPGHGYAGDDHEFTILENGHALMTMEQHLTIDMSQVVNAGDSHAIVQGNMFQEFDADKNVIFEWRSWDHLNIEDASNSMLRESNIDYVHLNSIAIDYDGHYVISNRHMDEVMKINRETGEIIWRFGGVHNQFEFINDNLRFSYQHCVKPVPGHPNHYTMFDNGNNRTPNYSRAVEYKLDTENWTAENVWEYRYMPDRYSGYMGTVQVLPNGNRYIDWSTNHVKTCEINSEGEKVLDFYAYGISTYRSYRFEWDGMMHIPYVILEKHDNVINLIFNKFGDQSVSHYNIYHRTETDEFVTLDSTFNTYYQAANLENHTHHYFRVTAVDTNGAESDFSETVDVQMDYNSMLVNSSFELPGTEKQTGFGYIPGWQTDTSCEDSGVEQSAEATEGDWIAFLKSGDPQVWQISDYTVQPNQTVTLSFDARKNSQGKDLEIILFYEEGGSHDPIVADTITDLTDSFHEFQMDFSTNNMPASINHQLGFGFRNITSNIHSWVRIDNVNLSISDVTSEKTHPKKSVPDMFRLSQNYPNPFNASTEIEFQLKREGQVTMEILNVLGENIHTLLNGRMEAGVHKIKWKTENDSGESVPSGVYVYRIQIHDSENYISDIKKMLLLK